MVAEPLVARNLARNLAPLSPFDVVAILTADRNRPPVDARAFPHARRAHVEYSESSAGSCDLQEQRQARCLQVIRGQERQDRDQYSWVVLLRTDTLLLKRLPSLQELTRLAYRPPKWSTRLANWSATVLIPPFWETGERGDNGVCMKWTGGANRTGYDRHYPSCHVSQLGRSKHVIMDQFAVIPRAAANDYLGRIAPPATYAHDVARLGRDAVEKSLTSDAEVEAYRKCFWFGHVVRGCECALSVALRVRNVSAVFVPFAAALVREAKAIPKRNGTKAVFVRTRAGAEFGITNGDEIPEQALRWAVEEAG